MASSTETVNQIGAESRPQAVGSHSLRRFLARGGATLGLATTLERGFGFLANLLAARIAGPQSFGAYSVVLSTAGTVAGYAGAGIGSTANRFSGQYPINGKGYRGLLRALILVSAGSALIGAGLMFAGAGPMARVLLHNEGLVSVLRIAAFSAGAMILLECCRGLFIGQQRFAALLLLSLVSGIGMLLILPTLARTSAGAMIGGHATVALVAVASCAIVARRLGLLPKTDGVDEHGPSVGTVLKFGFVQLSALVSLNIATLWLASLIARADTSLLQMGIFAVASQFRGLASTMPGLLAQISYPLLTVESGRDYGGPDRIVLVNTFLITSLTLTLSSVATIFLPWILLNLYGQAYVVAEVPSALLLGTAVVHMGCMPSANRLSITNLRALGVINTAWAIVLVLLGILFVPMVGAATGASLAFFAAHLLSQCAVLIALKYGKSLPRGLLYISLIGITGSIVFVLLAYIRVILPLEQRLVTGVMLAGLMISTLMLLHFGLKHGWLPKVTRRAS